MQCNFLNNNVYPGGKGELEGGSVIVRLAKVLATPSSDCASSCDSLWKRPFELGAEELRAEELRLSVQRSGALARRAVGHVGLALIALVSSGVASRRWARPVREDLSQKAHAVASALEVARLASSLVAPSRALSSQQRQLFSEEPPDITLDRNLKRRRKGVQATRARARRSATVIRAGGHSPQEDAHVRTGEHIQSRAIDQRRRHAHRLGQSGQSARRQRRLLLRTPATRHHAGISSAPRRLRA